MGRRERFEGSVQHQTVSRRRSPDMQRSRNHTSYNRVWAPKIPSWEKEFCYRVGLFRWDKFLEAKKLTEFHHRILEWNDSAAEEAFHRTKKKFYAMINGQEDPDESYMTNPDLYIDNINWDDDDEVNSELLKGLGSAVDEYEDKDENEDEEVKNIEWYNIRIEDIKPTGWDVDIEETNLSAKNVLAGLIVGC